jgi:hypothetical protein
MDFARSTFVVEVNETPTIAFQAKWAAEAEDVAFGWADLHASQLSTKGSHGTELPSVIKVRIARPAEKAVYEAGGGDSEFYQETRIVYLVEPSSLGRRESR